MTDSEAGTVELLPESMFSGEGSGNTLNVVIVHQDPVTRDWATGLWGRVTQLIGKEGVRFNNWRIADLTHARLFPDAVREAIEADVLLISVRATDQLPLELYVWIDAWLPRRTKSAGALVALLGVPDRPGSVSSHAHDYLEAVARKARLDYMPRERKLPPEREDFSYMENLSHRAVTVTPVLGDILSSGRESHRHWGINE